MGSGQGSGERDRDDDERPGDLVGSADDIPVDSAEQVPGEEKQDCRTGAHDNRSDCKFHWRKRKQEQGEAAIYGNDGRANPCR